MRDKGETDAANWSSRHAVCLRNQQLGTTTAVKHSSPSCVLYLISRDFRVAKVLSVVITFSKLRYLETEERFYRGSDVIDIVWSGSYVPTKLDIIWNSMIYYYSLL